VDTPPIPYNAKLANLGYDTLLFGDTLLLLDSRIFTLEEEHV
jgi:hypothetical protein